MKLLAVLALVVTAPLSLAQEDVPPIFAKLAFDKALEQNKTDQKLLVVKATATWCVPCKQMDQTTWRDEKVVKWFGANGVAIVFDVDKESALAAKLDIQAMPTMIAFKQGTEFDRVVGYKSATEFVEWLDGVKAGRKSIEAVRERARTATKGTQAEIDARYALAKKLLQDNELEKATEEFVWLWTHTADTSYSGVRVSFMAGQMNGLAAKHPPAKERFLGFRDEARKRFDEEKVDPQDFQDWIVLNDVVRESQKTLEWFDEKKSDPRWLPLLRGAAYMLEEKLIAAKRWPDVALLHPDPVAELQRDHETMEMTRKFRDDKGSDSLPANFEEMEQERFRGSAAKLHVAMLAAGDSERAKLVLKKALELDDSSAMRLALVQKALTAKYPREDHKALLDEAEKKGADAKALAKLREKLAKALDPSPAH